MGAISAWVQDNRSLWRTGALRLYASPYYYGPTYSYSCGPYWGGLAYYYGLGMGYYDYQAGQGFGFWGPGVGVGIGY